MLPSSEPRIGHLTSRRWDLCAKECEPDVFLLKALIGEFGGEATCRGMYHRLKQPLTSIGVEDVAVSGWIRARLFELEETGSVTVEATDKQMLIARITADGALRADDMMKLS